VFYKEYLQTYIGRDVRDDLGINNETKFYNFICVCAARTGCLINYADIARDADINVKTVKIWLEALERAGLVKLLRPYHANINKRIIKTPKLYFLDTGLCSYLTKWDSPETLMAGAMSGAILETYVFAEILKSYWHNGLDCAIYFFRDSNQKEIDFIIEKNMTLYPIEVKKTASPKPEDVKHFKTLDEYKHMTLGTGILLCLYPNPISISKNIIATPIWHI
jgi:predicted AAA+ superfamily ATPase